MVLRGESIKVLIEDTRKDMGRLMRFVLERCILPQMSGPQLSVRRVLVSFFLILCFELTPTFRAILAKCMQCTGLEIRLNW